MKRFYGVPFDGVQHIGILVKALALQPGVFDKLLLTPGGGGALGDLKHGAKVYVVQENFACRTRKLVHLFQQFLKGLGQFRKTVQ